MVVTGGVGISENLHIQGIINSANQININASIDSTNTTSGSLVVFGGAGFSGNIFTGSQIFTTTNYPSTSTTTGSLVVTGGAGFSGTTNIGGNMNAGAIFTKGSSTLGNVSINSSTISTTGGTLGISENVNIGGQITFSGGNMAFSNTNISNQIGYYDLSGWVTRTIPSNSWNGVTYGNGLFVALSNSSTINTQIITSADGITWGSYATTTALDGFTPNHITYGQDITGISKFVVVGTGTASVNASAVSTDGITWSSVSMPTTPVNTNTFFWRKVTNGKGMFVTIAAVTTTTAGHIAYSQSPGVIPWALAIFDGSFNSWTDVTYGNGIFVAVGNTSGITNQVAYSNDGINWIRSSSTVNATWLSIAYGNGLFVAGSEVGNIMTSSDGITWISRISPTTTGIRSLLFANGLFVAALDGGTRNIFCISQDGITWSNRIISISNMYGFGIAYGVVNGVGRFVALNYNTGSSQLITADVTTSTGTSTNVSSKNVLIGNNITLIPGPKEGYNWVLQNANIPSLTGIVYGIPSSGIYSGSGLFVAVSENGSPGSNVRTSPDGINWTPQYTPSTANLGWCSITYGTPSSGPSSGKGIYVAVANSGTTNSLMTSTNAINWTQQVVTTNTWTSICFGNQTFVAVANSGTGRIIYSINTTSWNNISSFESNWNSVCFGNVNGTIPTFVAVGDAGSYVYSTSNPPLAWTSGTNTTNNWQEVVFGNGLFVAVSNTGTGNRVMTSPDGSTWTSRISAADNNWTGITFGNGIFTAVANGPGSGNRVMVSSDGINWMCRSVVDSDWANVAYGIPSSGIYSGLGMFVAVARTSTNLMTSTGGVQNNVALGIGASLLGTEYSAAIGPGAVATEDNTIVIGRNENNKVTLNGSLSAIGPNGSNTIVSNSTVSNQGIYYDISGLVVRTALSYGTNWFGITYAFDKFYGFLNTTNTANQIITSSDGISWTAQAGQGLSSFTPFRATYGPDISGVNRIVVVGYSTTNANCSITSSNGSTWTSVPIIINNFFLGVANGKGMFVAVADSGSGPFIYYSNNPASSWSVASGGPQSLSGWYDVAYGNGIFVAINRLQTSQSNQVAYSTDGITWTYSSSAVSLTRLESISSSGAAIAYGNELFVATGGAGNIMTSPDGITWTARISPTSANIRSLTFANGLFIGLSHFASPAVCIISQDGITWSTRSAPIANCSSLSIAYGADRFVATTGDLSGNYFTFDIKNNDNSPNLAKNNLFLGNNITMNNGLPAGYNWMTQKQNISSLRGVCYGVPLVGPYAGKGLFVAVSENWSPFSNVRTSVDGINWVAQTTDASANQSWLTVCYGVPSAGIYSSTGLFVAISYAGRTNSIMTSPDGVNWTSRTSPTYIFQSIAYGNGIFVIVSAIGSRRIITSTDGITWNNITSTTPDSIAWRSVTYGNGRFVAVGDSGNYMYSTDSSTWTTGVLTSNNWYAITYGNGLFVATSITGTGNRVMTSPDGITWTSRTSAANNNWMNITYGNGIFVACANNGSGNRVMISQDGISWTCRNVLDYNYLAATYGVVSSGIYSGQGLFVIMPQNSSNCIISVPGPQNNLAIGNNTTVYGCNSVAIGYGAKCTQNNQIVIGSTGSIILQPYTGKVGVGCLPNNSTSTLFNVGGSICVTNTETINATNGSDFQGMQLAYVGSGSTSYGMIQPTNPGSTYNNLVLCRDGANVGIGTVSPGTKLDISGTMRSNGGVIGPSTMSLVGNDIFNVANATNKFFYFNKQNVTGFFDTALNYATWSFDPTGKLLISEPTGTAGDGASGTITLEHKNSGGVSSIIFRSNVNFNNDYGYIRYRDDVDNLANTERSRLEIGTENDSGNNTVSDAVILQKSGGFVGIGQKNPAYTLDVAGSIILDSWLRIRGEYGVYFESYGRGIRAPDTVAVPGYTSYGNITTYGAGLSNWSGYDIFGRFTFMANGDSVGIHDNRHSWGVLFTNSSATFPKQVTAHSYNANSDYRLKTNIRPITDKTIDHLKPIEYDLSGGTHSMGFLAHEIQEDFPFLVSGEKDGPTMQSINYNGFIALLVKEVQDLKKTVKQLQNKIEILESK